MRTRGDVSSLPPIPTASPLQRPTAWQRAVPAAPHPTPLARRQVELLGLLCHLLPVTPRWVLVPLFSNSNVIVLIIQRLPENLFQEVHRKVTFKTEVSRGQRVNVSSSSFIHSHVFFLPHEQVILFLLRRTLSGLVIIAPGKMIMMSRLPTPKNQSRECLHKDIQTTTHLFSSSCQSGDWHKALSLPWNSWIQRHRAGINPY